VRGLPAPHGVQERGGQPERVDPVAAGEPVTAVHEQHRRLDLRAEAGHQLGEAVGVAAQLRLDQPGVAAGLCDRAALALTEHVPGGQVPGGDGERPRDDQRHEAEPRHHPGAQRKAADDGHGVPAR
jgi:hypothetical protein